MGRRRKSGPPAQPGAAARRRRADRWLRGAFDAHRARNPREARSSPAACSTRCRSSPTRCTCSPPSRGETGRADLAVDLYRRLLRRHPAIPIAHNSLGNLLQGARPVAGGDRVLRKPPSPTTPLRFRVLQSRTGAAAHERPGAGGALPAPGGGPRAGRCPGPGAAGPRPGRAGQAGGGAGRNAPLHRARSRLGRDPQRRRSGPFHRRGLRRRPRGVPDRPRTRTRASPRPRSTSRSRSGSPGNATRTRTASAPRSSTAPRNRATQRDPAPRARQGPRDRGEWEAAFAHYERANRPFAEAAPRQADEWLAVMDRMRAVFDADLVHGANARGRDRRDTRVRGRDAALGHHAGRAVPGRASRRARRGRA